MREILAFCHHDHLVLTYLATPSTLKELASGGNQGRPKKLVLRAPSIEGVW